MNINSNKILGFVATLILLIFLSSCKEDIPVISEPFTKGSILNYTNPDIGLLDSMGTIHNETLSYLDDNLNTNFNNSTNGDFMIFNNTMSTFVFNNYGFSQTATSVNSTIKNELLNNYNNIDNMIASLKNILLNGINSSTFSPYCSSYEKNIVINTINFITDTSNFANCVDAFDALNKMENYADSSIALINNMTINDSLDQVFGLICLNTLKGSIQFWSDYVEEQTTIKILESKDEVQIFPILAAYLIYKVTKVVSGDAIGAACGYWGAVTVEAVENGSLSSKNRRKRIAAAAEGAVAGSLYAGLTP